jgi:hypothetical protein
MPRAGGRTSRAGLSYRKAIPYAANPKSIPRPGREPVLLSSPGDLRMLNESRYA